MPAIVAGHAAFFHLHRETAAAWAGGTFGGCTHHLLGVGVAFQAQSLAFDKADGDQVAFDHAANRGQDRGHLAPFHPCPTTRVEHGFQLFHHERDIPAAPEHRADHPRQRHGPSEMLHVLGIDKHFKRTAMA